MTNNANGLLGIDLDDPAQVAKFCLGLGYTENSVVNALVERCKLHPLIAQRIVTETMQTQEDSNG